MLDHYEILVIGSGKVPCLDDGEGRPPYGLNRAQACRWILPKRRLYAEQELDSQRKGRFLPEAWPRVWSCGA